MTFNKRKMEVRIGEKNLEFDFDYTVRRFKSATLGVLFNH